MRYLIYCFVLLLSACSRQPPITQEQSDWQAYQTQQNSLSHWQLKGKIAFISESQRQSANLWWQQQNQLSELKLTGPLGLDLLDLRYQAPSLWLRDQHGDEYFADNGSALLTQLTGWQLPLAQLNHALLGLPVGNSKTYQLNENARLAWQRSDDGWHIDYLNYAEYHGRIMPRQLALSKDDIRIKLIINDWLYD